MKREMKNKIVILVGSIGLLAIILIIPLIAYNKKQKEEDLPLEVRLEKIATERVSDCALQMQEDMRRVGLSDVRVEWSPCTKEEYLEGLKWDSLYENYEVMEHNFYYRMSYYSDEIATIFEEKRSKHEKNELLKFISYLDFEKQKNRVASNYEIDHAKIYALDTGIGVYVSDNMEKSELYFYTSDGHKYGYRYSRKGEEIYIDEEVIYFFEIVKDSESKKEEKPSRNNNKDSFYGGVQSSGEIYDSYDVEQYIDGDDFADEWADEFGDGDYDAGYDDAYDYWESESGYE